jgi:hypothetical protein
VKLYGAIAARFFIACYLVYLLWFLAFEYHPADPLGFHPPVVLWVVDVVNLFIHEAGHLFFRILGQTMSILGGSLMQCLLPLALAAVTFREKPRQTVYPMFWFGENLVNVAAYIDDAPYQNLKLIREGLIHDWHWLLAERLDAAEPMAAIVRWAGVGICAATVVAVVVALVRDAVSIRKDAREQWQ